MEKQDDWLVRSVMETVKDITHVLQGIVGIRHPDLAS